MNENDSYKFKSNFHSNNKIAYLFQHQSVPTALGIK